MNIKQLIFAAVVPAILSPVIAYAQSKPDPKVDELNYFQGSWTCQAKKTTDSKAAEFTWTVKRVLNDFWFLGEVTAQKKTLTHDTLGYNTVSEKFGRTTLTSDGRFMNFISDGWQKDSLVWEGAFVNLIAKKKEALREVVVKKSDREFSTTYYSLELPSQTWKPTTQETCKKQK